MSRLSQVDQLKAWFDSGRTLTVAGALQILGIYALSQRVGELKRSGYAISSEWVNLPSNKRVRRYRKFVMEEPKPISEQAQMSISL